MEKRNMNVSTTTATPTTYTRKTLANMIDHTVLKQNATEKDIRSGASSAIQRDFRAFVVEPHHAAFVIRQKLLAKSNVFCAAVCDFPKAGSTTRMRVSMINELLSLGIDEVDIVSKFYLLLNDNYPEYKEDIREVIKAMRGKTLKIILECDYLNEVQIRKATDLICEVAKEEKAKYLIVKTNTGFAKEIKTENTDALRYIKETLEKHGLYAERLEDISNGKIGIKVSARVKTTDSTITLLNAGAHIIGTSSGEEIVDGVSSNKTDSSY